MESIKFIGLICATWLFIYSDLTIFFKQYFKVDNDSEPKGIPLQLIQKFLNCSMCLGFWFGLFTYQSFFMACIISLTAQAFDHIVIKLGNYFTGL
jgi:hypothetical protein